MDKPVCDTCGEPVEVEGGRWVHSAQAFSSHFATVTAPQEAPALEPVDVDALVEKMWQAARSCPEVVWGKSSILAALRVAAEALGQTERLWPKPKTPQAVQEAISRHFGANPADWVKQLAMDCYRIGLEEKEGQSNG